MPKKFLTTLGIILLVGIGLIGAKTFIERHNDKSLIPTLPTSKKVKTNAKTAPAVTPVKPSFDKKKYSVDDPASFWVVVNKKRSLKPQTYAPSDLVTVGNGQQMRQEAASALTTMFAAAKAAGFTIQADSGYRSYSTQVSVYNNEVKSYGQAVADTESAKPGTSEHQTGWAVDVGGGGCHIDNCFGTTAEGQWVAAHAYQYGFIVRYTAAKQGVTGYRAEPWHIRYIGTGLAAEMHKENVTTLEEFFDL